MSTEIKSNTCPYCGGPYTLVDGGCRNKCADSQALDRLCNDAVDAEELIGITELDG
jgi:hypothetical protein